MITPFDEWSCSSYETALEPVAIIRAFGEGSGGESPVGFGNDMLFHGLAIFAQSHFDDTAEIYQIIRIE